MKIAVCVPHHGDVKALFAGSLGNMLVKAAKEGVPTASGRVAVDLQLFLSSSSSIAENRESAAAIALSKGSDYLLWLDTDMVFPPDLLARLMAHMAKVQIVGCNYPRRSTPTGPVAMRVDKGEVIPVYTTAEKASRKIVEQVDYMGLGATLMSAAVFGLVERPWFAADAARGEDGFFFHKVAAAGVKPFVDHSLSLEIGHIDERILTNADAEADRERWSIQNIRPAESRRR